VTAATTAAKAPASARAQTDRRGSPRHHCLAECVVRLEGAAEPFDWPGMVYNISAAGIGLALPFPALVGRILRIEPRRPRSGPGPVRARVQRSALQRYVWFHGCEFVEPLSAEQLRRWLEASNGRD
jgi:hypothetical protein